MGADSAISSVKTGLCAQALTNLRGDWSPAQMISDTDESIGIKYFG
jgi:hypothetical protein